MGKITCNVARDLIPLYVDDVLSNDSKEIVENHIAECEDCKKYYSQLKDGATYTAERSRHDQRIIKSISKEIRRKRNIAVGVAVIIVTLIAVVALFSTVDAMKKDMVSGEFSEKSGVSAEVVELHNKEMELKKQIKALDNDNITNIRVDMACNVNDNSISEACIYIVSKDDIEDAEMKSRIREITAQCLEIETTNIEVIYGVAE